MRFLRQSTRNIFSGTPTSDNCIPGFEFWTCELLIINHHCLPYYSLHYLQYFNNLCICSLKCIGFPSRNTHNKISDILISCNYTLCYCCDFRIWPRGRCCIINLIIIATMAVPKTIDSIGDSRSYLHPFEFLSFIYNFDFKFSCYYTNPIISFFAFLKLLLLVIFYEKLFVSYRNFWPFKSPFYSIYRHTQFIYHKKVKQPQNESRYKIQIEINIAEIYAYLSIKKQIVFTFQNKPQMQAIQKNYQLKIQII